METGIISLSLLLVGSTTKELDVVLESMSWELVGIISEPNCVFVDVRLSGKIDLCCVSEPDDRVLFTESDSLIGESSKVPRIGTLFDCGKIEGFVANVCALSATPVAID